MSAVALGRGAHTPRLCEDAGWELVDAAFSPADDVVSSWAASCRLVEPIMAIWGGPVRHYYSILMRKEPGTGGWAWHQVGPPFARATWRGQLCPPQSGYGFITRVALHVAI